MLVRLSARVASLPTGTFPRSIQMPSYLNLVSKRTSANILNKNQVWWSTAYCLTSQCSRPLQVMDRGLSPSSYSILVFDAKLQFPILLWEKEHQSCLFQLCWLDDTSCELYVNFGTFSFSCPKAVPLQRGLQWFCAEKNVNAHLLDTCIA